MSLSNRRARSVKEYLAAKGIEKCRLLARGYGASKPITPGKTRAQRLMNRRVEFVILDGRFDAVCQSKSSE